MRTAALFCAAVSMLALGLVLVGWATWPTGGWSVGSGHAAARLNRGTLELVWCTHDVRWTGDSWLMFGYGSQARVVNASTSMWRPNWTDAQVLITGGQAAPLRMTLTNVFIPPWPWAVLAGLGAVGLLWRLRRPLARHCCTECGYDLRGMRGSRCPECGREAGSIARLLLLARQALVAAGFIRLSRCDSPSPR